MCEDMMQVKSALRRKGTIVRRTSQARSKYGQEQSGSLRKAILLQNPSAYMDLGARMLFVAAHTGRAILVFEVGFGTTVSSKPSVSGAPGPA